MQTLNGKVAVITGGTRGLGLATARGLAAEGAAVVVASRSQASVDAALAELRRQGYRAVGLAVDVADLEQVEALAALAEKEFGRLDIWVNNAGVTGPYGPTVDLSPETFYRVIDTNIVGVYNGSRTAMRHFLAQGSGKLINILGLGADGPAPMQNAYAASKFWIRAFTLALAQEARASGVGVYAYNPGMVLTDLLTAVEVIGGYEDKLKDFGTIVRLLSNPPDQAAQGVVRLASPRSDGKTGLVVRNLALPRLLGRLAGEGWRRLLKQAAPVQEICITTIPPAAR